MQVARVTEIIASSDKSVIGTAIHHAQETYFSFLQGRTIPTITASSA